MAVNCPVQSPNTRDEEASRVPGVNLQNMEPEKRKSYTLDDISFLLCDFKIPY